MAGSARPGSIRITGVNAHIPVVVDINTTGTPTEFPAFSDRACTQSVALPATITTDTTFYVQATGAVMLSVKVDGTELAGPAEVFLTNAGPVTFAIDTDRDNTDIAKLLDLVSTQFLTPAQGNGSYPQDGAFVDLNVGFASTAAVNPGDDITTALQAAYDYIAANYAQGGTIRISKPGTYLLNGAPQTGTYTNGSSTYTWNGQILLPALSMANTKTIVLEGHPSGGSGDSNTGGPTGVVIQSNATAGYLIDCRPNFSRFTSASTQLNAWTGAIPKFRNITFLAPDNPTCGGLNLFATQRAQLERVNVQTPTFGATINAGTLAAVVWPQVNNNGDLVLMDSYIQGFPVGMVISEHLRAARSLIRTCPTAIQSSGTGHTNFLDLDVEECSTILDGTAYAGIVGTPNTFAGTMVDATIDHENVGTAGTTLAVASGAFVKDTYTAPVRGQARVYYAGSKPLPVIGGSLLDVVPLSKAPTTGPVFRAGWMSTHPWDNFGRLAALSGAGAPGQCSATLHPWRVESGSFAVSAGGVLTALTNPSYAFVPCVKGGVPRIITATVQLGTGGEVEILAESPFTGTGAALGGVQSLMLRLQPGSTPLFRASNTSIVSADGANLVAGTTYTFDFELLYDWQSASGVLQAQYPKAVRVYSNGTLILVYAIPAAQAAMSLAAPTSYPLYEDGIAFLETAGLSNVTFFKVRDAGSPVSLEHSIAVTANRTAWHWETTIVTANSPTITLPKPVADVPNTIINTGAGSVTVAPPSGTLTNLSGATGNITLTQGQRARIVSVDGTNYQQIAA